MIFSSTLLYESIFQLHTIQSICPRLNMHATSVSNHSSQTPLITRLSSIPPFISLPFPNVQSFIPSLHHSGKSSKDSVEDKNSVTSIYILTKECLYSNTEYVRLLSGRSRGEQENAREGYVSADEAIWTVWNLRKIKIEMFSQWIRSDGKAGTARQGRTGHTVKVLVFKLPHVQNWHSNPFQRLKMFAVLELHRTKSQPKITINTQH